MLTHEKWSAWISVDGKELTQYMTTVKQEVTQNVHSIQVTYRVSCWIASQEGKEFTVHISHEGQTANTATGAYMYMDGKPIGGRIFRFAVKQITEVCGQLSADGKSEMPFFFSRLALTDDDSAIRDASHLKDLGIIRIDLRRVSILPGQANGTEAIQGIAADGPVHETSKKAGAHCVSFGKARPTQFRPFTSASFLDMNPVIVFEFRYRSADLLRAQDIMPSIVKPVPQLNASSRPLKRHRVESTIAAGPSTLQGKVKLEEDGDEDVEEEIRALREKLKSLEKRRNKENNGDLANRPAKKPKVEPLDFSNFVEGEVIDLT